MLRPLGLLALVALLVSAAPAGAEPGPESGSEADGVCPAGTIPVGPFCVLNPLGGGPGYCPAGTIKVGPFCVIWPL